jgi:hypothetical protein
VGQGVNLESGVSLGQLLISLVVIILGGGVTWGGLLQRVKALEKEVEALSGFAVSLARLEAEMGFIKTELGKLTGSWLFREPPSYDTLERPMGQQPRTRRPK